MFRFGGSVGGKAIPVVPDKFGNGMMPDKLSAVMVYITKKPPVIVADQGLELDGKIVEGIPYYGYPMRGGVRVYLDDRLQLAITPDTLEEAPSETGPDGKKRWKLVTVLKQNGVDLSKVVEAWASPTSGASTSSRARSSTRSWSRPDPIRRTRSTSTMARRASMRFALHSHALAPSELPADPPRRIRRLALVFGLHRHGASSRPAAPATHTHKPPRSSPKPLPFGPILA